MGIFTNSIAGYNNDVDDFEMIDVAANESYNNVTGCAVAVLENTINDYALFEGMLAGDFQEVAAIHEGYEVVNESAADVINKIKEALKKLLAKIKGILQAFVAKLLGTFGESDKLYTKYLKTISGHSDWENFKVKGFRELQNGSDPGASIKAVDFKDSGYDYITNSQTTGTLYNNNNKKDKDELFSIILNKRCPELKNADKATDIEKEFMDVVYKEAETKDDVDSSFLTSGQVGGLLNKNAGKKLKEEIEKLNTKMTRSISKLISKLEKRQKVMIDGKAGNKTIETSPVFKTNYKSGDVDERNYNGVTNVNDNGLKDIAFLQKYASIEQDIVTHYVSARMKVTKFAISQARRVWASAAAYAMRKHEGVDYELYTAIGEDAAYDFVSEME